MGSVIHIAEIAAILTVAYVIGWAIGYLAHALTARRPVEARIVAAAATNALGTTAAGPVGADDAKIVSAELAQAEAPAAAAAIVPPPIVFDPIAAELPLPPITLSPIAPPSMRIAPVGPLPLPTSKPVLPAPPDAETASQSPMTSNAAPALRPGEAWSGEIRGRGPSLVPVEAPVATQPSDTPMDVALTLEPAETIAFVSATEPAEPEAIEPESSPPQGEEPVAHPEPGPTIVASIVEEPSRPAPSPPPVDDEDAAMRAIEGGWSRVGARALSGELEVSDVGVAVAAAQSAVEQVLARTGIDVAPLQESKPLALARPRDGERDDLKRINGLGSLDESTLNNLGVYHFDQIAGWTVSEVLWMESHVFARGRLGHENWQQQARGLATPGAL